MNCLLLTTRLNFSMKTTFFQTFNLLPKEFKNKSLLFIFLLIFTVIFETLGIGLIFPLMDVIINQEFTKNLFGINLHDISQNYESNDIIAYLASFLLFIENTVTLPAKEQKNPLNLE